MPGPRGSADSTQSTRAGMRTLSITARAALPRATGAPSAPSLPQLTALHSASCFVLFVCFLRRVSDSSRAAVVGLKGLR